MRFKSLFCFIFSFISFVAASQTKREPKNLKQAVAYLMNDCSDSLKTVILKTPDKDLKNLSYPKGKYKVIYDWIAKVPDINLIRYLQKKGVKDYETEVILTAFKRFLQEQSFNEKEILKRYQLLRVKWEAEYNNRFLADSLESVYVPKDLDDTFRQIDGFWTDSTKTMVKNWSEDEFSSKAHHGFGMWIRNNWGLWRGSRLSKYFNDMGIYHPDDMSGIILTGYHRKLNGINIQLDEQVAFYKDYWKTAEENAFKIAKEEFSGYKIGDTVTFKYGNGFVSEAQERKYDDETCIARGKITELNEQDFFIKVKVIDACDNRGIVSYDNKDYTVLNPKTKKWEKPKRHKVKYLRKNREDWFYYNKWDTLD